MKPSGLTVFKCYIPSLETLLPCTIKRIHGLIGDALLRVLIPLRAEVFLADVDDHQRWNSVDATLLIDVYRLYDISIYTLWLSYTCKLWEVSSICSQQRPFNIANELFC